MSGPQDLLPPLVDTRAVQHSRNYPGDLENRYFSPAFSANNADDSNLKHLVESRVYLSVGELERFYSEDRGLVDFLKKAGVETYLRIVRLYSALAIKDLLI